MSTELELSDLAKLTQLSTQVQGFQINLEYLVKSVDKLVGISEKQVELGHELTRTRESVQAAYTHINGVESKLALAIDGLTAMLREDRAKVIDTASTLMGYKTGIRTLMFVGGTVVTLLTIIGVMFTTSTGQELSRVNGRIDTVQAYVDRRALLTDSQFSDQKSKIQDLQSYHRSNRAYQEDSN